jgi:hypothetical protein
MKAFIYILSALLILCGLGGLAMPIAVFRSSQENSTLLLVSAIVASIVAIWFIATGLQHIRKKDKETALVVATTFGFLAWLITNALVVKLTRGIQPQTWQFVGLMIPILLCYFGTKELRKYIRRKYENRA